MLISITVPLLVCIAGLVLMLVGNPKGYEIGRIMFFAGLLTALMKLDLHLIVR